MRKLRADARWHTFTPEQQKKIQQWLFDDHLGYQKTRERMKTELGITYALSTISHLYHYLAELRENNAFLDAQDLAGQVAGSSVDIEKLRSASQMLIAHRFFKAVTGDADVQEIAALGRLMLQGESREIQRSRIDLVSEHLKLRALYAPGRFHHVSDAKAVQSAPDT